VWIDDVGSFLRDLEQAAHDLAAAYNQEVDLKIDANYVISAEPDERRS
jgi:hypothetical protein